jgi:molybdopterin-binding protein/molybdate transport repressor ModE-like protein
MSRGPWMTPLDRELLAALERSTTLVEACRKVRIGRDRGIYRIRRLEKGWGRPVTRSSRGGPGVGGTRLTPFGRRLLAADPSSVGPEASINCFSGVYRGGSPPVVDLDSGGRLVVAFQARIGRRVELRVFPDSLLVSPRRFPTSARNVLPARVVSLRRIDRDRYRVGFDFGGLTLQVLLTKAAVGSLSLRVGTRAFLYLKATAIHAVGIRRS